MPTTSSFDRLKDAISAAYPKLSRQLQQIAHFALERPNDLALGTVAGVAEAAGVQPSALIRFANALGFGGFSEMQLIFRERLLEKSRSYRERIDAMDLGERAATPESGVLQQFVGDAIDELGHLGDRIPPRDLAAAAALLAGAPRVHVLAQRRAFPVACYLAYALGQLELRSTLLDGVGGMLATALRNVDAKDVLLVVSFQNYSQDVIDAAAQLHAQGVPVIAITDSALSPLKPHASVCFELGQGPNPAFRSLVTPLCLAQALVVSAGHRLTNPTPAPRKAAPARRRTTSSRGARS